MNYDFKAYLFQKLSAAAVALNTDTPIIVSEEQTFSKMDKLEPNNIYVVIKYLSSDIQYYTETMPIQLLVLSEQNSLKKAQEIMNKFATENNWNVLIDGNTYIKQQYNSPVVLNNFVEVGYGYRSVLYMTGTLFIMENVVDVSNVKVNNNIIKPLAFNMSYSMSTNTQQMPSEEIASSLKTVSTFAITMTIPMIACPLVTAAMEIIDEQITGNTPFTISFECGLYDEDEETHEPTPHPISKTMRLISAQLTTAPNQVPGIQVGFMK